MEALSDILQPYKELVGNIAAIVTIGQMFSGSFLCYDIYKQKNTKGTSIIPFAGGLVMSILNLKYGSIIRDDKMIQVNFVGLALNLLYLLIYFNYTEEKFLAWCKMGLAGCFSGLLIVYSEMEDQNVIEHRFGTITTAFMFTLIASPLFGLKSIIKNKSTEGMPFPMILSGTVVTFMWLLYGIILKNDFLLIQNMVALLLCSVQLALFAIYPSKPKVKSKKSKKAD